MTDAEVLEAVQDLLDLVRRNKTELSGIAIVGVDAKGLAFHLVQAEPNQHSAVMTGVRRLLDENSKLNWSVQQKPRLALVRE